MGGLARGIDRISITENSATTHGYPIYDGHGNCRAILTKNGTDDYATGNWRTYDVWGSVRSGSATGDPKSRYVASIGHVADDESSLIYMRARYYESSTGRFISEDPAMDGWNWFAYVENDPLNKLDRAGLSSDDSFDPVYSFRSPKWWSTWWSSVSTLPLRVLGIIFAMVIAKPVAALLQVVGLGLSVLYLAVPIVTMYSFRILAWWFYLFGEMPGGGAIPDTPGYSWGFFDEGVVGK